MPFTRSNAIPLIFFGSGLTLAATLSLTGCTGTPAVEPSPLTSSSSSAASEESTPAPSPSESLAPEPEITPPVKPEAMKHNNEEGAIAFANYFLDVYEYTFLSGDTLELRSISATSCKVCDEAIEIANDLRTRNIQVVGYRVGDRENLEVRAVVEDTTYGIGGRLTQEGYSYLSATGANISTTEASPLVSAFVVSKVDGRWQVLKFGTEEK